ncbi:MAG: ABA4-like family protein [Polymorphobacter sp.]
MTNEALFSIASTAALAGWVMLSLAPLRRAWAVTGARIVAAVLSGGYVSLLAAGLTGGNGPPPGAGFETLAAVRLLLSSPEALLAGWVHYLAFDLFIGSWEAQDAPAAGIPHWLLLPCLALTFVAGPTGLLLYLILKAVRQR